MWTTRPYASVWRGPYRPVSVRVDDDILVQPRPDGVLDVANALSLNYARRDQSNVFTAEQNTFKQIRANRIHFLSDERTKSETRPVETTEAIRMVLSLKPQLFRLLDNQPSAGFLAQQVPPEYTASDADGLLAVDYIALLAHLWKAVAVLLEERAHSSGRDVIEETIGADVLRTRNELSAEVLKNVEDGSHGRLPANL